MSGRLVTTWYGAFLLDADGGVLASSLFPRSAEEIANRLALMRSLEVLDEERRVAPRDGAFEVFEPRLLVLPGAVRAGADAVPARPPAPEGLNFPPELLRKASLQLATVTFREALPSDQPVVLYLRALDLVEREGTRALEMLRYWHSFHFPEMGALVDDGRFIDLVRSDPDRDAILSSHPELDAGMGAGRPLVAGEGGAMSALAEHIASTRDEARRIRDTLEEAIVDVAPNLSIVAGPLVGARLLNLAGSLERLSRLPSSTVQLLGAERALFLHIKEGALPPKHGVIFQHPSVHSSPPWLRGRTARTLAGKISIAARADVAGTHADGGLGRDLRDQFLRRVQQLRSDHPEPPPGWKRRRPPKDDVKRRRGRPQRGGRRGPPKGRGRPRKGRR